MRAYARALFPGLDPPKEASLADIGEGRATDQDDKELVRRLMAKATAMLEDASEVAVAGQSPRLGPAQLAAAACRLQAAARHIATVAGAAATVADPDAKGLGNQRKSGP